MSGRPIRVIALLLALLLGATALWLACGSSDSTSRPAPGTIGDDDDVTDDDDGDDDADDDDGDDDSGDDDSDTTPPESPGIDTPPNPYLRDSIALTGTGEPGATIHLDVASPAGPIDSADANIPQSGHWCVIVDLDASDDDIVQNTIVGTVIDDAENVSSPTDVSVFVDIGSLPGFRPIASDAVTDASSENTSCDCSIGNIADERREFVWQNSTKVDDGPGWERDPQWVRFDFEEPHVIKGYQGISIIWDDQWATEYTIYGSTDDSPADPDDSLTDYFLMHEGTNGGSGQQVISIGDDVTARWVAIVLTDGNTPVGSHFQFSIKEVYVSGVPEDEYIPEPVCE